MLNDGAITTCTIQKLCDVDSHTVRKQMTGLVKRTQDLAVPLPEPGLPMRVKIDVVGFLQNH